MLISAVMPNRFVSAEQVKKLKERTVTISRVVLEKGINPKTRQPEDIVAVYFRGVFQTTGPGKSPQAHRLRRSERKEMVAAYGDDTLAWHDREVQLMAAATKVGEGVRIKPLATKATQGNSKPASSPPPEPGSFDGPDNLDFDPNDVPK